MCERCVRAMRGARGVMCEKCARNKIYMRCDLGLGVTRRRGTGSVGPAPGGMGTQNDIVSGRITVIVVAAAVPLFDGERQRRRNEIDIIRSVGLLDVRDDVNAIDIVRACGPTEAARVLDAIIEIVGKSSCRLIESDRRLLIIIVGDECGRWLGDAWAINRTPPPCLPSLPPSFPASLTLPLAPSLPSLLCALPVLPPAGAVPVLVLASVASMVGTPSSKLVDVPTTFASTLLVTAVGSVGSTLGMPSSKLVLRLTASTTFTSVVVAALSSGDKNRCVHTHSPLLRYLRPDFVLPYATQTHTGWHTSPISHISHPIPVVIETGLTASTTFVSGFTSVVVAALSSVFLTPIASAMPATPVTAVSVIPVSEAMVALGVLMLASVAVSA